MHRWVPEPNFSHFVGTVAVVCPRACSCLLAWDAGGSLPSAWIIPVSCGSTVEVEAQQCLRPSYLTVFANKAVVEERPHFPSVWRSSASLLSSPTSHKQDLAAVGCFSEGAISNHVIWSSDGKLRDFNTPRDAGLGLVERGTHSHIPTCAAEEDWEGTFAAGCLWMSSL